MMAAWMAYAVVISLLVSVAALIAERIAILGRRQSRWIWVSALLLSLLLPLLFASFGAPSKARREEALIELVKQGAPPVYEQSPIEWVGGEPAVLERRVTWDRWLLAGWAMLSALSLVILSMGWMQLRSRLRSGVDGEVDGMRVTVTHDVGPAVVGMVRPRIVIPRWLLQEETTTRAIALEHERQHLLAQDIRVLGGALFVAVLVPWNLPVWWQLRRLRFAIELDCDARVLRTGRSLSVYSTVLLNVATRLVPLRAVAAGVSESGSSLEKRIRIMHTPARKHSWLVATLLASCSATVMAVAANLTPPIAPLTAVHSTDGLPLLPTPVAAQKADEVAVARAVAHFYPQLAERQQDGRPYVWTVVNERGEVSQIDTEVRPFWDKEADFARNWQTYLERAGVVDSQIRQEIVMQTRVGPNFVAVAWATVADAPVRDPAAPILAIAPMQSQTMQANLLATADAQRRVIEHFDSAALTEGVPAGQELWFLIDADGRVQNAGRRATIADPEAARLAMQAMFPDISVGYVTRGTVVKDALGKRIPVSWQWME